MFVKKFFLILSVIFLFNSLVYAGWPEDGWEGVSSLRVVHRETAINFDELHRLLATEEEKVARLLPPNNTTNIVLASISFLGGEVPSLHTYHLQSPEVKWLVFESGWTSSFVSPVHEEAQKLMRPYGPKLQKEDGLTLLEKDQLVRDCIKVAQSQQYFEDNIKPYFHFFDQDGALVEEILERIYRAFSQVSPKEPGYGIYEELLKNRAAFRRVLSTLQAGQLEAGKSISDLSAKIDLSAGVNLDFIKELANMAKTFQEQISRREKELSNIGSKVISTYWHSEQKFLKFIEDAIPNILDHSLKDLPFKPEAVFINIHSRHDICSVCSHTLVRSYTQPEGTLSILRNALRERLKIELQDLPLYLTSSFREKRDKTIYNIKSEQLDSLERIYPAFPTLYIPLSLQ
ncbi:MAG: hypothetical protein K2P93_05060 [Alphaproteobacteria bacterium]|nr:hypothetical protein [Alphaproteobacteria bacterium]